MPRVSPGWTNAGSCSPKFEPALIWELSRPPKPLGISHDYIFRRMNASWLTYLYASTRSQVGSGGGNGSGLATLPLDSPSGSSVAGRSAHDGQCTSAAWSPMVSGCISASSRGKSPSVAPAFSRGEPSRSHPVPPKRTAWPCARWPLAHHFDWHAPECGLDSRSLEASTRSLPKETCRL